jgi:hypothetical protein
VTTDVRSLVCTDTNVVLKSRTNNLASIETFDLGIQRCGDLGFSINYFLGLQQGASNLTFLICKMIRKNI